MSDPVAPEGKLDLSAVSRLQADLVAKAGNDVVIDLGKVTHVGALCAQTCIAAARSAHAAGLEFSIVNASNPVLDQLGSMGLTPENIAEGLR